MNSSEPQFLDLGPRELRPWLDHPISRLLLQHLVSERDRTKDAICDSTFDLKADEALLTSGGLRVLETLIALFHPPEEHEIELEAPFVDPGAIPPPPARGPQT